MKYEVDHIPVLLQETVKGIGVRAGRDYVDATVGGAGHAKAILAASSPDGRLLGLDADPQAVARCQKRLNEFGSRVTLIHASFGDLESAALESGFAAVDGIVMDLGMSSFQLAEPSRGFSFQLDGPLDMRFSPAQVTTAADLVNGLTEKDLADLIWRYGEETKSRRIAREIVRRRPMQSTAQLAQAVADACGSRTRLHPATRTFMALRIATNDELGTLETALPQAIRLLKPGLGRLAVLSYHSLEDRVVKQWMAREARDCVCPPRTPMCICGHSASLRVINRKPIQPSSGEIERNPRSRSARLRLAERLPSAQFTPRERV